MKAAMPMSSWPGIFAFPRDEINWQNENEAYVETRIELVRNFDGTELDYVDFFVTAEEDTDEPVPQSEKLQQFCNGSAARTPPATAACSQRYIAWLDERSYNDGEPLSRAQQGPLTSDDLYVRLSRPRFRHRRFSLRSASTSENPPRLSHKVLKKMFRKFIRKHAVRPSDVESVSQGFAHSGEPDADRRLIFVTDLDPPTARALIRTVSPHQASALRDALSKHFSAEASISATFPSRGFATFRLSFHLPFFALRFSQESREDHRRIEGKSLRYTEDVSFLNWPSEQIETAQSLHQAHVTCVIAGVDNWCWVAYLFADNFFDGDDAETVLEYQRDRDLAYGMATDPLCCGNVDAEDPIWDPRQYFLCVFHYRLLQLKGEWQKVVGGMEQSLERYERSNHHLLSRQPIDQSRDRSPIQNKPRLDFDLTLQLVRLASRLEGCISATISAFEAVHPDFTELFGDLQQPAQGNGSLRGIEASFRELKLLRGRLGSIQRRGDPLSRIHEVRLNLETLAVGNRQNELAHESRGFTWIMVLYISPVALTTSIFSMQQSFLPLIQPTAGWFFGLIFVFSLLSFGVHYAQALFLHHWPAMISSRRKFSVPKGDSSLLRWRKRKSAHDVENSVAPNHTSIDQNDDYNTATQAPPTVTFSSDA